MGIGKSRSAAAIFVCAFSVVFFSTPLPSEALERSSGIWKVLRAGRFGGAMNEEAQVWPLKGSILSSGRRYKFWEYQWVENRPSGHGRNLLLVFEGADRALTYLGCYEFDAYPFHGRVHPQIRGNVIFFPYKDIEIMGVKFHKEISFEKGPPPEAKIRGGGAFFR